ncbi:TPA: hypothetical protein ACH3X1_014376 [Trebouxia sp. C0004]
MAVLPLWVPFVGRPPRHIHLQGTYNMEVQHHTEALPGRRYCKTEQSCKSDLSGQAPSQSQSSHGPLWSPGAGAMANRRRGVDFPGPRSAGNVCNSCSPIGIPTPPPELPLHPTRLLWPGEGSRRADRLTYL